MRLSHFTRACGAAASLLLFTPAFAQHTPAASTPPVRPWLQGAAPTNAALAYWRIWEQLPREFLTRVYEASQQEKWSPDAELEKELKQHEGVIAELIDAAQLTPCDWGVDYRDGIMALLPHLGKLRSSARLLKVDMRRCVHEGDHEGAVVRAEAIVRMSRQTLSDHTLISQLVGTAIAELAMNEIDVLVEQDRLSAEQAGRLLSILRASDPADPFRMLDAVEAERDWISSHLRRVCTGPDAGKKVIELVTVFDGNTDAKLIEQVRAMNDEELGRELDRQPQLYDAMVAAWNQPDGDQQLKLIEQSIEKGVYGPVMKLIAPAFSKARASDYHSRNHLRTLTLALENIK